MKKVLYILNILVLTAFVSFSSATAQSFEFVNTDGQVHGQSLSSSLKFHFDIKNVSDSKKNLQVEFFVNELSGNHYYSNCIFFCTIPGKENDKLADLIELEPGETLTQEVENLEIYLELVNLQGDNLDDGTSRISIIARDADNLEDFAEYTAVFVVGGTSVDYVENSLYMSDPNPNPAIDNFSVEYNLHTPGQRGVLEIYNALGKKVKSINLTAPTARLNINASKLSPGLYYYRIVSNGKPMKAKSLLITR